MGANAFFLSGGSYLRYNIAADHADAGYPLPIGPYWAGMTAAGFGNAIDVAIDWGDGKTYFFKGDQYLRYDNAADRVDDGYPLPIAGNWPGMAEAGFGTGLEAAVAWDDGTVYFFKGDAYVRYNRTSDAVDAGYPARIADNWAGLGAAGFGSGLSAAINWNNGKTYFFKGERYLRYDNAADRVDDGYPLPIAGNWSGLAEAGFANGIDAIVSLTGTRAATALTADLSPEFFGTLRAMGPRLGCHPVHLLGIMNRESGVMARALNPSSNSVGLNQILPSNLRALGWPGTAADFARLEAAAQLPYVENYFAPYARFGLGSIGRLYQINFVPASVRVDQGDDFVVAAQAGPFADAYAGNRGLDFDRDGRTTIADLRNEAISKANGPRWDEIAGRL